MADVAANVHPLAKNFLNKELYMVTTRPVRSPEITQRMGEHLEHQVAMEKAGVLFAAGPLFPEGSSEPEAGMFIVRAGSFEEARTIADADPLHRAGLRTYTLQKWRLNEGSFTATINYSDQTVKIG